MSNSIMIHHKNKISNISSVSRGIHAHTHPYIGKKCFIYEEEISIEVLATRLQAKGVACSKDH